MLSSRMVELVDSLLGKPYRVGAMGPHEFYCYGLLVYLFKQLLNKDLNATDELREILRVREQFESVSVEGYLPEVLDVIYYRLGDIAHVVMVESAKNVVSANITGVCRTRLDLVLLFPGVEIYRLKKNECSAAS